ncbi:hypothetical protein F4678DRAFT_366339 [Xylaria arbuscula]|nr:hypothetical protein F4678DRAFT_366339 [Xylaria arbuscula]
MMPHDTRSSRRRLQPAAPLSQRHIYDSSRIARRDASHRQGNKDLMQKPSHTSAFFSLPQNCRGQSEDGSETSLSSISSHVHSTSPSSKAQYLEDGSRDIVSPILGFQDNVKPVMAQDDRRSRHTRIVHFDFSKYHPATPGCESRPIKIEDSPEVPSSFPIRSRKSLVLQKHITLPRPCSEVPATKHGFQSADASYIGKEIPDGSSFMIFPGSLMPSAAVTTIITSSEAATTFLHCFLEAEKYWLRSRDHDTDPDIRFWKKLATHFNASALEYQIDTWLTARVIATTLCSQPYKTQVQKQLPQANNTVSCLLSAIEECRHMCQRRRRQQQSGVESVKAAISSEVTKEVQKDVLVGVPRTLEDRTKLLEALATKCAKQKVPGFVDEPNKTTSTTALRVKVPDKRKGEHLNSHTTSLGSPPTGDNETRPNVQSHRLPDSEVIRRNPQKRIKKLGNSRSKEGYSYSSKGGMKSDRRGPLSSRRTADEKGRLERRVKELERELKFMKQKRHL